MGDSALTLAIETSNPTAHDAAAGVALVRVPIETGDVGWGRSGEWGGEVLAQKEVWSADRHGDPLMPAIDWIMRDAHLKTSDIDRVAVSVGPGGYTSCRIAVTTAKIICRFTGAKAIPVPTAIGVCLALENVPNDRFTVCLAWKGSGVWIQDFDQIEDWRDAVEQLDGRMESIDDLNDESFGKLVCDSKLAKAFPENRTIPIRFDPLAVARASAFLEPVDPMGLAVAYPREPEAVRKWRELGR